MCKTVRYLFVRLSLDTVSNEFQMRLASWHLLAPAPRHFSWREQSCGGNGTIFFLSPFCSLHRDCTQSVYYIIVCKDPNVVCQSVDMLKWHKAWKDDLDNLNDLNDLSDPSDLSDLSDLNDLNDLSDLDDLMTLMTWWQKASQTIDRMVKWYI